MKESVGDRIKRLRKQAQLSQQAVADAVGVSRVAVTKWESGQTKDMRLDSLRGLAKLFGIQLEVLLDGTDFMADKKTSDGSESITNEQIAKIGTPIIVWEKPSDLPDGEFAIVTRYDVHVACGNGHIVYDEMPLDQGSAYRCDWLKSEGYYLRNLFTVQAVSESMEPSIYAGDALLVDRAQSSVQDGQVFLLRFGDEVRVKRLYKRADGGIRVVSDNASKFPEEVVTAKDMSHIQIIGRVVHKSGRM